MKTRKEHDCSRRNRSAIDNSSLCGCFYCQALFNPSEVINWCDKGGQTALCPRCGIDSVLGDSSCDLSPELLLEMSKEWF